MFLKTQCAASRSRSMTPSLRLSAPAKLNLFLAITGRRSDGFHNLVSLAVPLDFGDELELRDLGERGATRRSTGGEARLVVEGLGDGGGGDTAGVVEQVPSGGDNLVLKAAAAFREASGFARPIEFVLKKQIPVGAGLGGGSSDAAAALRGLNALAAAEGQGRALDEKTLCVLAAKLGADCAFFVRSQPAIMRGRGELLELLSEAAAARLCERKLFVCKPEFGVNTAWAYGQMAAETQGRYYLPEAAAERLCAQWLASGAGDSTDWESLIYNNMEPSVFLKYPALPVLAAAFRERFGLTLRMSGSGSACFAFLPETAAGGEAAAALIAPLRACVREYWGERAFTRVVRAKSGLPPAQSAAALA